MEYKDYYKILEIDKSASDKEIKSAYRKLAKKYHPDLNQGDEKAQEKFKEIGEAYEVLSDPEKKKTYDTFGSTGDFTGGMNFDPSQYGYSYSGGSSGDFSDFFEMFFGGQGSQRSHGGFNMSDIFGGRGGQGSRRPRRTTYNTDLTISIQDAYNGVDRNVTLTIDGKNVDILVKVPAGITSGKKVKVKGEKFGVDGDILFKINIMDGVNVRLDGLDIYKTEDIYPWQAVFGDKVLVSTPSGKVRITVPKDSRGGMKVRLAGKGFKNLQGRTGDLYVQFNMINPADLNEEQINLYKKIQEIQEEKNKGNNE